MSSKFVDEHLWTRRYQRNNKRTGLKNLRCFPMCSETHRFRGFCGRPVMFRVNRASSTNKIHVWGELIKSDAEGTIKVGDRIPLKTMLDQERSKDKPFNPYIPGDPVVGDTLRKKTSLTFEFNRQKRGWHYGWVANKHTCDSEHMMRTYVFEQIDATTLLCVEGVNSPTFSIFCRRRQRDKVDDLPPQIRQQLDFMAKQKTMKLESEAKPDKRKRRGTSSAKRGKKSKKLDSPASGISSSDEVGMVHNYGKNSKVFSLDPLGESKQGDSDVDMLEDVLMIGRKLIPHKIATVADNAKAIRKADKKRVDLDAKLFRVTYALLQYDGSNKNGGGMKSSTKLKSDPLAAIDAATNSFMDTASSGSVASSSENNASVVSSLGTTEIDVPANISNENTNAPVSEALAGIGGDDLLQDMGDFSRSIADCLDNYFPEWNTGIAGLFSADDLDSLGGDAQSLTMNDVMECKVTCTNVINELAQFLVEEHSFTELISRVFTQDMEKCSPAIRRRVFFDLLEEHLTLFLTRFDMTLDELDDLLVHALSSQYGSTDSNVIPFKNMGIESHISLYCATSPKPRQESTMMSFPNVPAIQSAVSTASAGVGALPLMVAAAERAKSIDNKTARVAPPPGQPDFTGVWEREISTLDKLESIRETIGVPWMLRKIFKQIESRFEIWHSETHMNVQSNKKLMSSGFMSYRLDGKEHPWDLPPPVFTGRPVGVSYLAKVEGSSVILIHNYSTRKRLVRRIRKSSCGTHLDSTLVYQDRETKTKPWRNIVETTLRATRVVASPPAPNTDGVASSTSNDSTLDTCPATNNAATSAGSKAPTVTVN